MNKKTIIISAMMLGSAIVSMAQNEDDAIRYINIVPAGTAKFNSMGGAMGAIGADFTAMSINPAGLSVTRSGYFSVTPSWNTSKVKSTYYGESGKVSKTNFNFSNIGFSNTYETGIDKGCKSVSFGFAYNRLTDFNRSVFVKGENDYSMLDYEIDFFDENYDNLFYDADLFIMDSASGYYYTDYEMAGSYGSRQSKKLKSSGSVGEYAIMMGFNLNDKWYFGASFNIMRIDYFQSSKYEETPSHPISLDNFSVYDEFHSVGGGINVKLGTIYWLNDNVRLGLAYHTPTIVQMEDDYYDEVVSSIYYDEENLGTNKANSSGAIDWELNTPGRFIASLALVSQKLGMIDVDCEVVNYSNVSLDTHNHHYDFSYVNDVISDIYRTNVNLRVGGELLVGPMALRGGVGYYGSPYVNDHENSKSSIMSYSAGVGFRMPGLYVDLGYSLNTKSETYYLYGYDDSASKLKNMKGNFALTIGFRYK